MAFSPATEAVSGNAGTSSSVTLSTVPAVGTPLIATLSVQASNTVPAITAPSGFSEVARYENQDDVTHVVYLKNSTGDESTLTWANDDVSPDRISVCVEVYGGSGPAEFIAPTSEDFSFNGTEITVGPLTAQAGDLLHTTAQFSLTPGSAASSWSNGFTSKSTINNANPTLRTAEKISSGGSESTTHTLTAQATRMSGMLLVFRESTTDTPTITNINTDNEFTPGETNTLNGTNLSTTGGSIVIDGEAQTITNRTATAITFTGVRGGNPYNTDLTLTYTDADSNTVTQTVQQVPAEGFAVTASSPNTTDDASLWTGLIDTGTGDPVTVVDGDQALVTDPNNLGNLAVTPAGEISADTEGNFVVQFWRAIEGVWGSDQTVSFTLPADNGGGTPVDPIDPGGQSIRSTIRNTARNTVRSTRRSL